MGHRGQRSEGQRGTKQLISGEVPMHVVLLELSPECRPGQLFRA